MSQGYTRLRRIRSPFLKAAGGACVIAVALVPAQASAAPAPDFSFTPNPPTSQQATTFTATPDAGVVSWDWDFDNDGQFDDGTGASATHTFPKSGPYKVSLQATDILLESGVVSKTITVGHGLPPTAAFTAPTGVVAQTPVTFSSTSTPSTGRSIATVQWDFDNNGTVDATGATVPHTFATSGSKSVRLRVVDDDGQPDEVVHPVTVAALPKPVADFTPAAATAGQAVTLTSTSTAAPGHTIAKVEWDLDNNGTFEATGPSVQHTFPASGEKFVPIRVTDDVGQVSAIVNKKVTVAPAPAPILDYSLSPVPVVVGKPATFTAIPALAPGRTVKSIEWYFGADNIVDATTRVVQRTFPAAGPVQVRLRVTDDDNQVSELSDSITVNAPPKVEFVALPASPLVGQQVTFVSYSADPDGTVKEQAWDLDGDGQFDDATGPLVKRTFTTPGARRVGLRVTDQLGTSSTLSQTITIKAPLVQAPTPPPAGPSPTPDPPAANPAPTRPPLLTPFPIVRLVGAASRGGARIQLLAVRAPKGARVLVRCKAKSCPKARLSKVAGKSRVRFRKLERFLPAGAILEIHVRGSGRIGKYTRFKIRSNRFPQRTDGCLWPGQSGTGSCPTS